MLDKSWLNQAFCQYNHHWRHGGNLASGSHAAISLMLKGVRRDHFSPGLPRGTSTKFPITSHAQILSDTKHHSLITTLTTHVSTWSFIYGIRERKGTWEHVKLTRQQNEHILSFTHLFVIQCLLKTSHTTNLYIEIIRKQWKESDAAQNEARGTFIDDKNMMWCTFFDLVFLLFPANSCQKTIQTKSRTYNNPSVIICHASWSTQRVIEAIMTMARGGHSIMFFLFLVRESQSAASECWPFLWSVSNQKC
jgi:hypothetical protein